jgi:hypothetical protein
MIDHLDKGYKSTSQCPRDSDLFTQVTQVRNTSVRSEVERTLQKTQTLNFII